MNDMIDPDRLHDPRDAAAYWFAREQSGGMAAAERARFEAWLQARPDHALEYRRARGAWHAMQLIPADRLRALAHEPVPTKAGFWRRRGMVLGAGMACAVVVATSIGFGVPLLGEPTYSAEFSTQRGERQQVVLPDGSRIDLNTDTSLAVRFYEGRRVIELSAGEATFSVASNPEWPFDVGAGDFSVRVTGTRFNVRRDGENVDVAVASGSVEARLGPWWHRQSMALTAGQGAQWLAHGSLIRIDNIDASAIMAWRQGRVVFPDTSLVAAIAEINRYAVRPIRLQDAGLADIRIAGVFNIDDLQAFLDLLPDIAPVDVRWLTDGTPVVMLRQLR